MTILPFDQPSAEAYGSLRAELEASGRPLAEPDLRIAAIATAYDLTLVTGNVRHFRRVPNLPVEDWLAHDFSGRIDSFLAERLIEPLNYEYLASVRRDHDRGHHRAALLWSWLVLEQWYRLWIEGEAVPQTPAVIADREAYELLVSAHGRPAEASPGRTDLTRA